MVHSDQAFQRWSAKYAVGVVELLVLHDLSVQEMYGAEVLDKVQQQVGANDITVKRPTVYALLKRLEEDGMIAVSREEMADNTRGTARRYYGLTASGTQLLQRMEAFQAELCHITGDRHA